MSINSDIEKLKKQTERLFYQRLRGIEQELLETYKTAQKEILVKLRALYDKLTVPLNKNQLNNASQFNRLNNLEQQIDGIIKELNRVQKLTTGQTITNEFAEGYYSIGYQLEGSLQTSLRFGLLDSEAVKGSLANPMDRIGWKKRTNFSSAKLTNQIRSEITSGLIQGNGYQETSRNISRTLGKHFDNDVLRIVRTEGQRARSWGDLTGHEQAKEFAGRAGVDIHRIWLSTLDGRTRIPKGKNTANHREIDGRKEEKNGNFIFSDGVVTAAPLMSGVKGHDIYCRCTTIDVVDNETPKMRRDNVTKKVVPFEKYSEYKSDWINKKKSPIKKPVNPLPK